MPFTGPQWILLGAVVALIAAASVLGALNFGLAGLISPIVGVFGIDNAIPMASVMGCTAAVSLIVLVCVVRPRTVPALSR